jgi:hypothetical protein
MKVYFLCVSTTQNQRAYEKNLSLFTTLVFSVLFLEAKFCVGDHLLFMKIAKQKT